MDSWILFSEVTNTKLWRNILGIESGFFTSSILRIIVFKFAYNKHLEDKKDNSRCQMRRSIYIKQIQFADKFVVLLFSQSTELLLVSKWKTLLPMASCTNIFVRTFEQFSFNVWVLIKINKILDNFAFTLTMFYYTRVLRHLRSFFPESV